MDDAWTPATTHVVIATPSGKRYWDDLATRSPGTSFDRPTGVPNGSVKARERDDVRGMASGMLERNPAGAPLLDWWEIPDDESDDPMSTRYLVGDVFDRLAEIPDGSVDLVVTSPPFLALRSYLPANHPQKAQEIGSEPTPAAFIDVMLAVTAELRRVLAPHGSIAVELGDTYAGSGGGERLQRKDPDHYGSGYADGPNPMVPAVGGPGWPLPKSRTMIPQLYEVALAYGINPLTGQPSPAGKWRVRNVVTWCRPNPPVGALGDKWRPATSDVVVACVSDKRYWDDLATRVPFRYGENGGGSGHTDDGSGEPGGTRRLPDRQMTHAGAPLLDYWVIPPKGYSGAHYAVYPQELVAPLVKAMCPQRVCLTCGEPSRRIVSEPEYDTEDPRAYGGRANWSGPRPTAESQIANKGSAQSADGKVNPSMFKHGRAVKIQHTEGWTDCGHDNWRTGITLDPFAGSGTTLAVAQGHGRDSVGIDLDERNAELAQGRLGMFLEVETPPQPTVRRHAARLGEVEL